MKSFIIFEHAHIPFFSKEKAGIKRFDLIKCGIVTWASAQCYGLCNVRGRHCNLSSGEIGNKFAWI